MFKTFCLTIISVLFSATLFSQAVLLEKVEKKGDEMVIPYEKYMLPNGLTVILHEDHSDPVVHVDVTYHVGSGREVIGRSGFAHFFEHMMFQGSEHVADEEHFRIISEAGGTLNGSTTNDRTNYFETLPNNQLEVALWLESDRMGFLLDAVTAQKFEVQRATVINERGQRIDNRPYGRVAEKVNQALYSFGHPYSWPTIGWIEDLRKADVNDLKRFFLRWYGPNNAVLTIAGDIDPKQTVQLVEKYFGPINTGPAVNMPEKTPVSIDKDRYISYEDNIRFPYLQFTFPTVPNYHPDEAPLDVLSNILGGTPNSLFYKNFVKNQVAVRASAEHPAYELTGQFQLKVYALPDKSLAEMEKLIRQSLEEFASRGVNDDDLQSFKSSFESGLYNTLASVSGKAGQLAQYQTFTKNADFIKKDLARYQAVTKEDVMRVFNKYIKNQAAVILSVYPKGKKDIVAHPDNFSLPQPETANITIKADYDNLVYNKPKETFDRSKKPLPGPNPEIKVPELWQKKFGNGVKIIGTYNNEIPTVVMQISIEAGHYMESNVPGKAGIAELLASLLNESSLKYTTEEMSNKLEKLGSSIDFSADKNYITVTVNAMVKNLDSTLALLEERMFHPRFDAQDFERVKNQQLEGIGNQATQPVTIANNVYNFILYGEKNILSLPTSGTAETVKSITLDDVKDYYKKYFSPATAKVVVVGDVKQNVLLSKIGFLKSWKGNKVKLPGLVEYPAIDKTRIYLVDKEGAPQSEIRIGYPALRYDAYHDYYKCNIMNYTLGGEFNSRINLNLREAKGYTYGARSSFSGDQYSGLYTASAGVRGDATDSSVVEFMKEIKNFADNGIKPSELEFTKSSIGQSDALKYESPLQKASFLKRIIIYNLEKDFVKKQSAILKSITEAEINALAKKYLPYDKMIIVVVGDKKSVEKGLKNTGYEVIETDKILKSK